MQFCPEETIAIISKTPIYRWGFLENEYSNVSFSHYKLQFWIKVISTQMIILCKINSNFAQANNDRFKHYYYLLVTLRLKDKAKGWY